MEQEITARGGPALGMYASDRELFEQVWQRVCPEDRPDCPIAVSAPVQTVHMPSPAPMAGVCTAMAESVLTYSMKETGCQPPVDPPEPAPPVSAKSPEAVSSAPAEPPEAAPPQEAQPLQEPLSPPVPDRAAPEPPALSSEPGPAVLPAGETDPEPPESAAPGGDDFPRADAVPCLGSGSAGHGGQLQEDILSALEGWQLYRHLARKVTGNAARTLSALASEKHRQARKLAAAYFLISGVRYWPIDKLEAPKALSWLGTLRRRFAAEQQLDSRWRAASLDTEDACLADLYGELAEGCAAHAGVLRTLLENAL